MTATIHNSAILVTLNSKGAELISLKDKENREYIWNGNPKYWNKHSPVLFPVVGTLKNNNYYYNNVTYTLPRHGFARDLNFEIAEKLENSVTFSLIASDKTKKCYPFDFEFQIIYTLTGKKITVEYRIINKNDTEMPFSIGAHPAFLLQNEFGNYTLEFDNDEKLSSFQLENDLLSDKTVEIVLHKRKLPLDYSLFEKDALIFKTLKSKNITLLENENPLLSVQFDDFKNLGIWTKNKAPFICIEPWLGYSDTINSTGNLIEKEGIQFVEAQKTFHCHFSIEIV